MALSAKRKELKMLEKTALEEAAASERMDASFRPGMSGNPQQQQSVNAPNNGNEFQKRKARKQSTFYAPDPKDVLAHQDKQGHGQTIDLLSALASTGCSDDGEARDFSKLQDLASDFERAADSQGLVDLPTWASLLFKHCPRELEGVTVSEISPIFYNIDGDSDGKVSWDETYTFATDTAAHRLTHKPAESIRPYSFGRSVSREDNILKMDYLESLDKILVASKHRPLELLDPETYKATHMVDARDLGAGNVVVQAAEYLPQNEMIAAFTSDMRLRLWHVIDDSAPGGAVGARDTGKYGATKASNGGGGALPWDRTNRGPSIIPMMKEPLLCDYRISQLKVPYLFGMNRNDETSSTLGSILAGQKKFPGLGDSSGGGANNSAPSGYTSTGVNQGGLLFASTRNGKLQVFDIDKMSTPRLKDEWQIHQPVSLQQADPGATPSYKKPPHIKPRAVSPLQRQRLKSSRSGVGGGGNSPTPTNRSTTPKRQRKAATHRTGDVKELPSGSEAITDFCFLPPHNMRICTAALDHTLMITDLEGATGVTSTVLGTLDAAVTKLAYHEGHGYIVCASVANELSAWVSHHSRNPSTQLVDVSRPHRGKVIGIHCVKDSPQVLSVDDSRLLKVWDLRMFRCAQSLQVGPAGSTGAGILGTSEDDFEDFDEDDDFKSSKAPVSASALSLNYKKSSKTTKGGISSVLRDDKAVPGTSGGGGMGRVNASCFVQGPGNFICGDANGLMVHTYDKGTDQSAAGKIPTIAVSYNASSNSFVTCTAREISTWDAEEGTLISTKNDVSKKDISCMCVDSKGRRTLLGCQNGEMVMVSNHGGAIVKKVHLHEGEISHIIHSERYHRVITCGHDGALCIFHEKENTAPITRIRFSPVPLISMAAQTQLQIAACGSSRGKITIVDLVHMRNVLAECDLDEDCTFSVTALCFLGSFPLLAAAYSNGDIAIWSVRPAKECQLLYQFNIRMKFDALKYSEGGLTCPVLKPAKLSHAQTPSSTVKAKRTPTSSERATPSNIGAGPPLPLETPISPLATTQIMKTPQQHRSGGHPMVTSASASGFQGMSILGSGVGSPTTGGKNRGGSMVTFATPEGGQNQRSSSPGLLSNTMASGFSASSASVGTNAKIAAVLGTGQEGQTNGPSWHDSDLCANSLVFDADLHILYVGDSAGDLTGWKLCPLLQYLKVSNTSYPLPEGKALPILDPISDHPRAQEEVSPVLTLAAKAHKEDVFAVEFLPMFQILLTCGDDRRVIMWDAETGRRKQELSMGRLSDSMIGANEGKASPLKASGLREAKKRKVTTTSGSSSSPKDKGGKLMNRLSSKIDAFYVLKQHTRYKKTAVCQHEIPNRGFGALNDDEDQFSENELQGAAVTAAEDLNSLSPGAADPTKSQPGLQQQHSGPFHAPTGLRSLAGPSAGSTTIIGGRPPIPSTSGGPSEKMKAALALRSRSIASQFTHQMQSRSRATSFGMTSGCSDGVDESLIHDDETNDAMMRAFSKPTSRMKPTRRPASCDDQSRTRMHLNTLLGSNASHTISQQSFTIQEEEQQEETGVDAADSPRRIEHHSSPDDLEKNSSTSANEAVTPTSFAQGNNSQHEGITPLSTLEPDNRPLTPSRSIGGLGGSGRSGGGSRPKSPSSFSKELPRDQQSENTAYKSSATTTSITTGAIVTYREEVEEKPLVKGVEANPVVLDLSPPEIVRSSIERLKESNNWRTLSYRQSAALTNSATTNPSADPPPLTSRVAIAKVEEGWSSSNLPLVVTAHKNWSSGNNGGQEGGGDNTGAHPLSARGAIQDRPSTTGSRGAVTARSLTTPGSVGKVINRGPDGLVYLERPTHPASAGLNRKGDGGDSSGKTTEVFHVYDEGMKLLEHLDGTTRSLKLGPEANRDADALPITQRRPSNPRHSAEAIKRKPPVSPRAARAETTGQLPKPIRTQRSAGGASTTGGVSSEGIIGGGRNIPIHGTPKRAVFSAKTSASLSQGHGASMETLSATGGGRSPGDPDLEGANQDWNPVAPGSRGYGWSSSITNGEDSHHLPASLSSQRSPRQLLPSELISSGISSSPRTRSAGPGPGAPRHGGVPLARGKIPKPPPKPDPRAERVKAYEEELKRCMQWNKKDLEEQLADEEATPRNWSTGGLRSELFHNAVKNTRQYDLK